MSSNDPQLAWTDDQWNKVQAAVQEAARNARVASTFLPLVGPLPSSTTTVPKLEMNPNPIMGAFPRLAVDEYQVLRLATISANVYVRTSELTDPELASATAMFARSASLIARVEDAIVFNGVPGPPDPAGYWTPTDAGGNPIAQPLVYRVSGGTAGDGLVAEGLPVVNVAGPAANPEVVDAVVTAIQRLEQNGHYGPFACVLGHELFTYATRPYPGSGVLPSERITLLLNGPLLRSSTIQPNRGVVVALAGDPVDLVIATDINVRFLQLTTEPRYVFRVCERMALRIKQHGAVVTLER
jgi:uncharacterized linocin/CFP29 family protein